MTIELVSQTVKRQFSTQYKEVIYNYLEPSDDGSSLLKIECSSWLRIAWKPKVLIWKLDNFMTSL